MRNSWLVCGLPFLFVVVLLALATPGGAKVTGPCTGTINGQEFHGEVKVPENGTVGYMFSSNSGFISSWTVELEYFGASIPIDDGSDEEPDKTSISGEANVNDYAWMGVGLYHLVGTVVSKGGTCTGSVDILVEGNPLTTLVGGLAAVAVVAGGGGAAVAGGAAAKGALAGLKP